MKIEKNAVVTMEYTLTNPAGEVLDTSKGRSPLTYLHGAGGLIPGLERELEGKTKGDNVKAVIAPADAYGEHDSKAIQQVSKSAFKGVPDVKVGMQFQSQGQGGHTTM